MWFPFFRGLKYCKPRSFAFFPKKIRSQTAYIHIFRGMAQPPISLTNEELFEEVTQDHGPRLKDLNGLDCMYKSDAEKAIASHHKFPGIIHTLPEIHYDFFENNLFEAFADKRSNKYFIAISVSVSLILFDLFHRMLSHPGVFKNIGNATEEEEYVSPTGRYNLELIPAMTSFKAPKNADRCTYAGHITRLAMRYIFEHEFSHILFGHVDYHLSNSLTLLDYQTLEMDADCTAIARFSNLQMDLVEMNNAPEFQKFLYRDYHQAICDLVFAIYTTYLVFGDGDFKNIPGSSSHPEPRIRQLMALMTFEKIAQINSTKLQWGQLSHDIGETIGDAEKAYHLITGATFNPEPFNPEFYAKNPLPQTLLDNWALKVRKGLHRYTYKELAP